MKIINSFKNFKINEYMDVESPSSCKAASLTGEVTLYRLVPESAIYNVDLESPGKFYFCDMDEVNPDFLEEPSNELFLITVKCDSSNIDIEKSEAECDRLGSGCIVGLKDDTACEVISVEQYKKDNYEISNSSESFIFESKDGRPKLYNELVKPLKDLYNKSDDETKETLKNLSNKLFENPKKIRDRFTSKISKFKTLAGLIKELEDFLNEV